MYTVSKEPKKVQSAIFQKSFETRFTLRRKRIVTCGMFYLFGWCLNLVLPSSEEQWRSLCSGSADV